MTTELTVQSEKAFQKVCIVSFENIDDDDDEDEQVNKKERLKHKGRLRQSAAVYRDQKYRDVSCVLLLNGDRRITTSNERLNEVKTLDCIVYEKATHELEHSGFLIKIMLSHTTSRQVDTCICSFNNLTFR